MHTPQGVSYGTSFLQTEQLGIVIHLLDRLVTLLKAPPRCPSTHLTSLQARPHIADCTMASIVSSHDQNAEQRDDAAAAAEPSSSPSADPFWQSTPRSEPGDLTALMAAVQQGSPFARLFNKAEEKPALAPPVGAE